MVRQKYEDERKNQNVLKHLNEKAGLRENNTKKTPSNSSHTFCMLHRMAPVLLGYLFYLE